jgi:hypothetical protein
MSRHRMDAERRFDVIEPGALPVCPTDIDELLIRVTAGCTANPGHREGEVSRALNWR